MKNLTRRELLKLLTAASSAELASLALQGCGGGGSMITPTAPGTPAACSTVSDIQHVVIFIQENRSFDHYFGSYRGVRGF
jgi:phospholipase C